MANLSRTYLTHDLQSMYDAWMDACEYALSVNRRYLLGGEDPKNGIDCSGLALFVLNRCGFSSRLAGVGRLTADKFGKLLFTRPLTWAVNTAHNKIATGRDVTDPYGPDPRLGSFGEMFRAYFLIADPANDHIVLGYGREFGIESTSGLITPGSGAYEDVGYREKTWDSSLNPPDFNLDMTYGEETRKTGVRVRHVDEFTPNVYSSALFLSFDALQAYFLPVFHHRRPRQWQGLDR